jgi:hypothetical protein
MALFPFGLRSIIKHITNYDNETWVPNAFLDSAFRYTIFAAVTDENPIKLHNFLNKEMNVGVSVVASGRYPKHKTYDHEAVVPVRKSL